MRKCTPGWHKKEQFCQTNKNNSLKMWNNSECTFKFAFFIENSLCVFIELCNSVFVNCRL